jgi:hypothetical protein
VRSNPAPFSPDLRPTRPLIFRLKEILVARFDLKRRRTPQQQPRKYTLVALPEIARKRKCALEVKPRLLTASTHVTNGAATIPLVCLSWFAPPPEATTSQQ